MSDYSGTSKDFAASGPLTVPSFAIRPVKGALHSLPVQPRPGATFLLTFLCDLVTIVISGTVAVGLWLLVNPNVPVGAFIGLWPLAGLFPLTYLVSRLYAGGLSAAEELRRLVYVNTSVYGVVLAVLFLSKASETQSRGVLLLAWLFTVLLVPAARTLLRFVFARFAWWGVPVVILGAGKTAGLVVRRLLTNPSLGFKPLACFDDNAAMHGSAVYGVPVLGDLSMAAGIAREFSVDHAVVAMPGLDPHSLQEILKRQAAVFRHLTIIPNMFGGASAGLSVRDFAGVVGLYGRRNLLVTSNRVLKRIMDILMLLPLTLLALPIVILAAVAIMVVSPGNPFYFQERVGLNGKPLKVWKLRTMFKNADELLEKHLASDPAACTEWERFYKLTNDPRILPGLGHVLRKLSLDELPQLWNIWRGEMSFVGPRPFPGYHLDGFDEPFQDLRRSVVPGLTGLWQVSARSDGDLAVQKDLDSYYIHNWSLWLDVYLIILTPWAVLFPKGAY